MYEQSEKTALEAQIKKRWTIVAIVCALLFIGGIVCMVLRQQILCDVCFVLTAFVLIFCYGIFLKPLHAYLKLLSSVLGNRRHELTGAFGSLDMDVSVVDGVPRRAMTIVLPDEGGKTYERMFYCDCEKPMPAFAAGEMVTVTYNDKSVIAITAA